MPYKYPIHPFPVPAIPHPRRTLHDCIRDSNTATEIFFLRLRPDARIDDTSTPEGTAWLKALDSIRGSNKKKQPAQPGFGRLYWGRCEGGDEDNDVVILMIDWNDLSLHEQHHSHSPFTDLLSPFLLSSSSLSTKIHPYPPFTASATTSPPYPLVALTVATFPRSMDAAEKDQIPSLWQYTRRDLQPRDNPRRHGCLGAPGGWVITMGLSGEREEGEGEKRLGAERETETGTGTAEDGIGGRYVMVDVWGEKGRREEWQGTQEGRLLWSKWEERATEGLRTWLVRLRLCEREGGGDEKKDRDTQGWVDL